MVIGHYLIAKANCRTSNNITLTNHGKIKWSTDEEHVRKNSQRICRRRQEIRLNDGKRCPGKELATAVQTPAHLATAVQTPAHAAAFDNHTATYI